MATKYPKCMFCGYNLSGLDHGSCPECGRPVYRFTNRARQVIADANEHAIRLLRGEEPGQKRPRWWWPQSETRGFILPCHVLVGLISGPEGVGRAAILACGTNLQELRDRVVKRWPARRAVALPDASRLRMHTWTHRVVREAIEQSHGLGHTWVGTEHLLLALCTRGDWTSRRCLLKAGVTHKRARAFVIQNMEAVGGVDAAIEAARAARTSDTDRATPTG